MITVRSECELAELLRRAANAHHKYETEVLASVRDEQWAEWYAEWIVNTVERLNSENRRHELTEGC